MLLILSWRNIWRNKARSLVIMLSVATGLLAGIAVMALYKGMLKSRVRTVIDRELGHLQIHHPGFQQDQHPSYILAEGEELLRRLEADARVDALMPRTIAQGMLVTTTGSAGVQINAVQPEREYQGSQLGQKIKEGSGFEKGKTNQILIGRKLARKMKLKTGAKLVLTFADKDDNLVSSAFRIAGIYQSGNDPLDEMNVYLLQSNLNELLQTGNGFHELAVHLRNDADLPALLQELQLSYPQLRIESWQDLSPETDLMVKTVDQYSVIILAIVLVALAFGILNTMLMAVLERTREIGMMTALGMSRLRIFFLVMMETIFLTLAGAPLGLGLAFLITSHYQKNGLDLSGMGEDMMASFGFETMVYPEFPWDKITMVMIMVGITALLACLLPSWKALRMQPVEALKK